MSAYYLAIADGELHYLCSNGKGIAHHEFFTLADISDVKISVEGSAKKVAKYMLTDNNNSAAKPFLLSFRIEDEKYSFNCQEMIECFAKFKIHKQQIYSRKMGQNPYSRAQEGITNTDTQLLYMFMPESAEKFKSALQARV